MAPVAPRATFADALNKGAKVITVSKRSALASPSSPTVLTDVTTDMVITKEENFGPVTPPDRFKTDDKAVKMANGTEFGLAAYFTAATSAAYGASPRGSLGQWGVSRVVLCLLGCHRI